MYKKKKKETTNTVKESFYPSIEVVTRAMFTETAVCFDHITYVLYRGIFLARLTKPRTANFL